MPGETDLGRTLAGIEPAASGEVYGYACLPLARALPAGLEPLATFREAEGLTVIAPAAALEAAGVDHQGGWAMISLGVHSALTAVGLTAAVSAALSAAGISANVVAAYHHDHVFVPWEERERALAALAAAPPRPPDGVRA